MNYVCTLNCHGIVDVSDVVDVDIFASSDWPTGEQRDFSRPITSSYYTRVLVIFLYSLPCGPMPLLPCQFTNLAIDSL